MCIYKWYKFWCVWVNEAANRVIHPHKSVHSAVFRSVACSVRCDITASYVAVLHNSFIISPWMKMSKYIGSIFEIQPVFQPTYTNSWVYVHVSFVCNSIKYGFHLQKLHASSWHCFVVSSCQTAQTYLLGFPGCSRFRIMLYIDSLFGLCK